MALSVSRYQLHTLLYILYRIVTDSYSDAISDNCNSFLKLHEVDWIAERLFREFGSSSTTKVYTWKYELELVVKKRSSNPPLLQGFNIIFIIHVT